MNTRSPMTANKLKHRVFNPEKVPLRLVLILPFVLQIFAAVGLTGWLSLRNGQKAVNDVASQLRREVTARISDRLQSYVATPNLINQLDAKAIASGQLKLADLGTLQRSFWDQMRLFNSVSSIAFGSEQGEFTGVGRGSDGILRIGFSGKATQGIFHTYAIDSEGKRDRLLQVSGKYDPRKRPWYKSAIATNQPNWSDVYTDFVDPRLTITASQTVYNERGVKLGVMSTDLVFTEVGDFLKSLKIGKNGQTFIIERSGYLVASSTAEVPFLLNKAKKEAQRLKATDSQNLLTQQTANYLSDRFPNLNQINSSQQLDFDLQGAKQFLQVTPLRDNRGLDWLIVVVVPEADFMAQIDANTRTTLLLCLLALSLATLLGIFTSRWITQPILRMNEASQAIASGKLDQKVAVKSITELRVLAQSFNQMARQLRESFTALEKTNESLEHRVLERTAELKAANNEITILNHRLQAENLRMSAELAISRRLQQMLLPKEEELNSLAEIEIAGFMEPAEEVGGDYYDILNDNGRIKIGIGDVTGHGLESGVLTIMVQTAIRTLLVNNEINPNKFLSTINQTIYNNVQRMDSDKTLSLCLLDYHEGMLGLSGQHEEIIIVRSGGKLERIDTIDLGFPIGLEADISEFVGETKIQLYSGDVVVLYTDGITEAENQAKVQYGIERLCQAIAQHWQLSAQDILQKVIEDLRYHIGAQKVQDDITLVVFKQK